MFSPTLSFRPAAAHTAPPPSSACSSIATASAPRGTPAPVIISIAEPARIFPPVHASPARTCPDIRSLFPAVHSFARTANPSRVDRSNGG